MTVRITVVPGDLTRQQVDVVVNAANSTLLGGGGVDGALHAAAGPRLREECRRLRNTTYRDGLPVGQAVATGAGDLGQTDPALLASCFPESLRVSAAAGARSVAFPAISAGAYGWDVTEVARIAVDAVRRAEADGVTGPVEEVRFVPFSPAAERAFRDATADPLTG
ncbi:MAG: macro domain-containing protein [Kineosporiaceae bacterium]